MSFIHELHMAFYVHNLRFKAVKCFGTEKEVKYLASHLLPSRLKRKEPFESFA